MKPPFEIYQDCDLADAGGHICTAENPEIAKEILDALNMWAEITHAEALIEPCTEAARDAGCICGWSPVNSASIDPPHEVVHINCPLHGNAAARDPDAAYEAMRDDPPPPYSEDDF